MRFILQCLLTVLLTSFQTRAQDDFSVTSTDNYQWSQADWSLTTTRFTPGQYQSRLSLANGYVGASLAAAGPFFEIDVNQTDPSGIQPINGWPLYDSRISFSTISGFYNVQPNASGTNYPWLNQYGWESLIAGIPHPTALIFAFGDNYLDATVKKTTISNFASKISFQTGVGEWSYTWTPENGAASFNVSYAAIFSRKRPNVIAVKATITPTSDIKGTVTDLLDGRSAARSYLDKKGLDQNGTVHSSVHPNGLANVTAYIVSGVDVTNSYTNTSSRAEATGAYISSNDTTIGQTFDISLKKGETATFYKYVGAASNDKFPEAEDVARQAQSDAQGEGWDALLKEHTEAWAKIMTKDSVDDFSDPVTGELPTDLNVQILHITSVANTYYLLQSMQPDGTGLNDNSISVGGLVSDSYAGLVFWDADYWMAPGLNLAYPNWSKQISNYRIKQHEQAMANAAFNNYPNGSALYSWTSGRYGNCTGTGPCVDYQYHLNHDIAFNLLQQYNVTNNKTWFDNGPRQIIESAAIMTSHLLQYNETTKTYWIHNMTDPDEYANNIDNGAFTLGSAAELLEQVNALRVTEGLPINETWGLQAAGIAFPSAPSNITLEYPGMNNSVAVKQADIVLLAYPLDYGQNYTEADKLLDLDYYANRQSPDGPAMTYSIFAINANALSPSGCSAYSYTLNGFLPYLRAPWFQFSEQEVDDVSINGGTNPAFPFLTGHGGANQVVPFGFLGIRTDQPVLYLNPSLPPQIPHIKVRTIYFAGATLEASINRTHTTITRRATSPSVGLEDLYADATLPFIVGKPNSPSSPSTPYSLAINQTITVDNRMYWEKLTNENNLLQCLPVTSSDPHAQGQFPNSAIDGATSTRWQPSTNSSASILVNMTGIPSSPISGIFFDWGTRPPKSAVVYLGNTTDGTQLYGTEDVITINDITPSMPYNETEAAASSLDVVPGTGNTTTIKVAGGAWSGMFARLEVEGCWEDDGDGATVGEFVLIRA
ncbi:putative ATH1 Acid trehalase, vacuolar [Venustampulla echinocandica]|uniref:alpha,alpha-trehalase n=1 Tax=Venustampulla echinocandica TaxID=2656787 RepID=A0A370TPS2_9HELO|nr:putative ATH1 Acid trehalase, vacuolar [Venustampulla echinocandica]RDL37525.1 putative ATH1 Acid trehalase, vacuolar [Venustampulla echinocandica]